MSQKHPGNFTTFDAKRILKLKRDRLKDWIMRGYIVPTRQEPVARGKKSIFDLWGLYMIKLFHHVVSSGIARKEAAKFIKELTDLKKQQQKPDPMEADFLMIKRKKSEVVNQSIHWGWPGAYNPDEDFDDAYVVNFSKIRKSVDSALEKIKRE